MDTEKNEILHETKETDKDDNETSNGKNSEKNSKNGSNNININISSDNNQNEIKEEENNKKQPNNDELYINLNNILNLIKDKYSLVENNKNEKEKTKNIIQEFVENKDILKNKDKLISFINELSYILTKGYNIIIPFLELFPSLIKYYIESDLDEEEGESELKYIKIFELLKYNSFISREYLRIIYNYFSHLFYLKDSLSESDKILNKFRKMIELWNIFYTFYPEACPKIEKNDIKESKNTTKKENSSNFCFLGSGLKFIFKEKYTKGDYFSIEMEFEKNNFLELNKDLIIIEITSDNNSYKLYFKEMLEKTKKNEFPKKLNINISENRINLVIYFSEENPKNLDFIVEYNPLQEIIIFENYFGQINRIWMLFLKNNVKNGIEFEILPYFFNDNCLIYNKEFLKAINFTKSNLAKVNYINYLEKGFDLENYFLGVQQMIPFVPLINGIYLNKNIKAINGLDKNILLKEAFRKILINFITIIGKKNCNKTKDNKSRNSRNSNIQEEIKDEETIDFQKYDLFIFVIILQLPLKLILRGKNDQSDNLFMKLVQISQPFYNKLDEDDLDLIFNSLLNVEEESFKDYVNNEKVSKKISKDLKKENPLLLKCSYQQLYRHIMKELFIYNRLWSIKELFFSDDYNNNDKKEKYFTNLKLKYKQISYYTKSFEQPILYPVLEINEYIPKFTKYDKSKMFRHNYEDTVNYDFNLKRNEIMSFIDEYLDKKNPFNQEKIKAKCCLIKKGYHVKGEIILKNIDNAENNSKDNNKYCLIFISDNKDSKKFCNKEIKKKKAKNNILDELCYGSIFNSPKKELNRKIIINLEDINLILIRNYFKRTSAIEIFTSKNNKSYYFNFDSIINFPNFKNPIMKFFDGNKSFYKIKFEQKKHLKGFYNSNQENVLFSLFFKNFPKSLFKNLHFFNHFDLLILINILSNRSFKDLYQYPVFPTLYKKSKLLEKESEKERDMSEHMGLQTITKESKQRAETIKKMDNNSEDDEGDTPTSIFSSKNRKSKENHLFNIHYSNPVYTGNYLLRIFPYSLISIELQGDGFDSPNRQFYSVKKALYNILSQKTDLREFIPELYYFPDLFINKNNLNLGKLVTGEEIDNLYIEAKSESYLDKYKFMEESKKYFLNDNELDLSSWIDLIFGINQEMKKENGREYYSKDKYIRLNYKEQKEDINNPIHLELVEFGIQPIKIFEEKFPDLRKINNNDVSVTSNLMNYSLDEFYNVHMEIKNDKEFCFYFEWDESMRINKYLLALNLTIEKEKETEKNNVVDIKYYNKYRFIGNVFGDVIIYHSKNKITEENNNSNNNEFTGTSFFSVSNKVYIEFEENPNKIIYGLNEEKNANEKILIKLSDHYKQIKYIDYNPRLNLFLSYGLDGYINIYVFPKCKLVKSIKAKDITKSNDILERVVLVSSPFAMIFMQDSNFFYSLTINGDFINKKEINKDGKNLPCIDKNLGLMIDSISEIINTVDQDGHKSCDIHKLSLPFFEKISLIS